MCLWSTAGDGGLMGLGRSAKGSIIRYTRPVQRSTHSSYETQYLVRKGASCVRITASHADTFWGWRSVAWPWLEVSEAYGAKRPSESSNLRRSWTRLSPSPSLSRHWPRASADPWGLPKDHSG